MDLAASIQVVAEELLLDMARHVHQQTQLENLVLPGGVALNCDADARSNSMQTVLNLQVKFRESFRPFAPVLLREQVHG
jgi:predicted NodU family carbamoyl transferase